MACSIERTRSRISTAVAPVIVQVVRDRAPERLVPQHLPQHVQDQRALLVEVPVEDLDRRIEEAAWRSAGGSAACPRSKYSRAQSCSSSAASSWPWGCSRHTYSGVGREALVEPALAPLATGEQIAEPLMGQLVRDQILESLSRAARSSSSTLIGQRGRGRVLHAAEDEVGDDHLRVLLVGIRHAERLREQLQHLRRARQRALRPRPRGPGSRR